jgi:GNAT superfamily N-acetyltransferase
MSVRTATGEDVQLLANLNRDVQQLHADALPHIYKPITDSEMITADIRDRVLADTEGRVFVAETDLGEAVGYIYAKIVRRPEHPYVYAQTYVHIDVITVRPAYQGQGYGQALIDSVVDWARTEGIARITLDTLAFNVQAQAFFAAQGFKMFRHVMEMFLDEKGKAGSL